MKRSGFTRARVALKRRTRLRPKRRKPGVTGRPSLDRQAWNLLKQALWKRAGGRCEVPWCRSASEPLDPHHCRKRSQGGADALLNLALLCREHHEQIDAPYAKGRLIVELDPVRRGPKFHLEVRPDKFTARTAVASGIARGEVEIEQRTLRRREQGRGPFVVPRREDPYPTVPQRRGR